MNNTTSCVSYTLLVTGLVQGVGFRPFVYRCANRHGLNGWIENRTESVVMRIEGENHAVEAFIDSLRNEAPVNARIVSIERHKAAVEGLRGFIIRQSNDCTNTVSEVGSDLAVCDDCLNDMNAQPHRLQYPFINCTACGPRFSIIQAMPYDRVNTTMQQFAMCNDCRQEYDNPADRRFHAQPIACTMCGPTYTMHFKNEQTSQFDEILTQVAKLITNGLIVAMRGMGGYHLICDAANEQAVARLRTRKMRDAKPFAVMFRDIAAIKQFAAIDTLETELLLSAQRPVVLLQTHTRLAPSVSQGLATIGAMLPYLPIHFLLFKHLTADALVMTSGNTSSEPIIIDNSVAVQKLSTIADAIVTHNRDIHNRVDDSVVMVAGQEMRMIRRSRGYVPRPLYLDFDADGIIACGALLKNSFALGAGNRAILSQHIGDLDEMQTWEFYTESIERFKQLFRLKPSLAACDLHPDYLSTRYAHETSLPIVSVQHHHAHIAACMAEHGLNEQVIGVSFDGTGLGDDGTIWGGEFFSCDLRTYNRIAWLKPVALPGGNAAAREPWRMALSYLYTAYGQECLNLASAPLTHAGTDKSGMVVEMIDKRLNTLPTSSMGRLFDAVASIIGLCHHNRHEAEAAMILETVAQGCVTSPYPLTINSGPIDCTGMIRAIVDDISRKTDTALIAARFQSTIVALVVETVLRMAAASGQLPVVLSGGVFQNRYILEQCEIQLREKGVRVFTHHTVPSNDGGIALGQLAIAAKRRETGCV